MLENKIKEILNHDLNFEVKEHYLLDLNKKLDRKNMFLKKMFYTKIVSLIVIASVIVINSISYFEINEMKINEVSNVNIIENKKEANSVNELTTIESKGKNNLIDYNYKYQESINKKNKAISIKNTKKLSKINYSLNDNNSNYTKSNISSNKLKKLKTSYFDTDKKHSLFLKNNSSNKNILFGEIESQINFLTKLDYNKSYCEDYLDLKKSRDQYAKTYPENQVVVKNFKKKWSLSILTGISTNKVILSNYLNKDYGDKRSEEEQRLNSPTFSVLAERLINEKFKFSLGINYTTYGSNNDYSPSSIEKNQQTYFLDTFGVNVIPYPYFYQGRWFTFYDTSYFVNMRDSTITYTEIDSTAYKNSGKSKFSYVELPIMIGYYEKHRKWNFALNTGVSFGILTRRSGYFINHELDDVKQASTKKLIVNLLASPEISYDLNHNLKIGIQPIVKINLNNLSTTNTTSLRYLNTQINAKLAYDF